MLIYIYIIYIYHVKFCARIVHKYTKICTYSSYAYPRVMIIYTYIVIYLFEVIMKNLTFHVKIIV